MKEYTIAHKMIIQEPQNHLIAHHHLPQWMKLYFVVMHSYTKVKMQEDFAIHLTDQIDTNCSIGIGFPIPINKSLFSRFTVKKNKKINRNS